MSTPPSGSTWRIASGADLARALADVRHARGLSQADVADLIGVHRTYLAELESGRRQGLMIERVLRALRRMGAEVVVTLPPEDARD